LIQAIDVVKSRTSEAEFIIEVNDCSLSLGPGLFLLYYSLIFVEHEEEDLQLIRELLIKKMTLTFSSPEGAKDGQSDSASLYKKLEVQLINAENSKMELEKKLRKTTNQLQTSTETNQQWRDFSTNYFSKVVGASLAVGFAFGVLVSYYMFRHMKRK
jgi:hypothetical protein